MKWEINEGQFGMAAHKMHSMLMQYMKSNDEKTEGDKEWHLGFGDVTQGHDWHQGDIDGSIRSIHIVG